MTQLVVDAERRDEVPPIGFSPRRLHCPALPTLKELRASLDLHRLVWGYAEMIFKGSSFRTIDAYRAAGLGYWDWYSPKWKRNSFETPSRKPAWIGRMCNTILKFFTLGAALAGAYNEPLVKAKNHPDPEVKALACKQEAAYNSDCLKGEGVRFLTQFAVYDLEASLEAQDAVFGPAADWLFESILSDRESRQAMARRFDKGFGRARYCAHRGKESGHCPVGLVDNGGGGRSHSDAHLVVWQLMRILWVYEQIRPQGWGPNWKLSGRPLQPLSPCRRNHVAEDGIMPRTSAVFIPCGSHRAQTVTYLIEPCNSKCPALKKDEPTRDQDELGTEYGSSPSINRFLELAFRYSGRANFTEETRGPVAPLGIKFFEYFLRRHLGLRFRPCVFFGEMLVGPHIIQWRQTLYARFVDEITLFADDRVRGRRALRGSGDGLNADFLDGSELLTAYEPERQYYSNEHPPREQGWA
jgi:hypothetical protein